ncbi:alkaline phosphatase D family protein [Polaribacter sp.]|uniref:alkaline phosphatase D family protein n=1 Tax=Polaribacter sp. TaxID=1920175 RepID=UPI003F6B6243
MIKKSVSFLILVLLIFQNCKKSNITVSTSEKPPIKAPFKGIDTIATNDWWNRKPNNIINVKVDRDEVVAFGIYTLHNNIVKLTAQLFPLYPNEIREVRLEIKQDDNWQEIQKKEVNDLGWSTTFRVENWDTTKDYKYRILHGENAYFEGVIRKDPINKQEITMAALSCNSNRDRGDRDKIVNNINFQNPDLVFFAGDQSYDHTEHTAAWLKFGMQFREVFRNRPCVTIPDDHDYGQGNFWGEYGKKATTPAGDDGGFYYHPAYAKMVERCQTAHLPDAYDPLPIEQGIGVYYTSLVVGGVDFAIIEDRKFKSGPNGEIPQAGPRPDHILDPSYNPESINLEGLELLGERQLNFLEDWGKQNQQHMKVVLSQTGFCGGAHLHGKKKTRLHADLDSNGWPQTGRNKALELIKKANAIHIAGDQHLATVIQHGIDEFDDGPWAFVVPAIVNNYYSRWWLPEDEKAGANTNGKLPWNGQFLDGFDNKITMHAYVNPDNPSNGAGYGLIKFKKNSQKVVFKCWPRDVDVSDDGAKQFNGFPVEIDLK